MTTHRPTALRAAIAAVGAILLLTSCEAVISSDLTSLRSQAGRPALPEAMYLTGAARANSEGMCTDGAATPSPSPNRDYDGETARSVDEKVGRAALDPSIEDPTERDVAATSAVWEQWRTDPVLTQLRWDEMGVGEKACADGYLYLTLLLRDGPSMPASGRYSSVTYTPDQITSRIGLVYGHATDHEGHDQALLLDLFTPPYSASTGDRPLLILVHGGGFVGGSRTQQDTVARAYAQLGFVTASIDYRLRPSDTEAEQLLAAIDAVDDGMESVRWLRSQASTYHVDPTRVAALGSSAGGGLVLGIGEADDPTPGGPLAAFSPKVDAVVSTGASLSGALDAVGFTSDDAPAMVFYHEQDTSKYMHTWDYAYRTCTTMRAADIACDFIKQKGSGHTIPLGPTTKWWTPEIGPYLWYRLDLAHAAGV